MKLDKDRLERQPDFEFRFRGRTVYMFFETMTEFIEWSGETYIQSSCWRTIDLNNWGVHLVGDMSYPETYAKMIKAHLDWCADRAAEDILFGIEPTP